MKRWSASAAISWNRLFDGATGVKRRPLTFFTSNGRIYRGCSNRKIFNKPPQKIEIRSQTVSSSSVK